MLRFITPFLLVLFMGQVQAGITLGGTRLIYNGSQKEATISITNSDTERPYLVQSWVDNIDNSQKKVPFVITPPLFKVSKESEHQIRVSYIGNHLPADRESIFLLNVNAIPAVEKNDNSKMIITIKNIIKLIYRPTGLSDNDANNAINRLEISRNTNGIQLTNPTAYYVNLNEMRIDGKSIDKPGFIPPFSNKVFPTQNGIKRVTLTAINDYGGTTEERQFSF
ncbi:molecular chaperone [Photorhabdus temperata]|uniref:P pilus assembly protein, chaperone PapD n=1 Tax=Photorhabdus temperata subsp. temperata Meg1 TaxID=1393735 RepID=A0A081RV34_PHOTE|nr:molecular chaperone [Photorhabdus temperata]EQC00519.1 putative fimbrial chaperone yrai precursor [Photorhabdus temperata subsp. temperata M1021]KER02537.1 P pilus assembly protein, chaperone PapD [Photorhabdus temperata subsp. temperata Meg1]MCT8348629.1 molecular chaperone [Photorhabdus temperata]